jgi:ketosteroid isomerase-like protein
MISVRISALIRGRRIVMSSPTASASDIAGKIRTANEQFMKRFHEKDAVRVASLYAREALLLPPGAAITEGLDAVTRFWKGAMDMGITDVTLETVSVEPLGDAAIELGMYTLVAGSAAVDQGKYLVVWRTEDGVWKLYRDIWNTSRSAAKT